MKNNTWNLTALPEGCRAIGCRWLFKIKHGANGEIEKYKARLVAKGFSQRQGFDYNETYVPVAKLTTLRTMLSIANQEKLMIHQMDVKAAFLNGNLDEEIFMNQPEGFTTGNLVCKLNKSIYGLKQASRMWNQRFHDYVIVLGFKRSNADYCLYYKIEKGMKIYLLIYVDDLLLISSCVSQINEIKKRLSDEFEMTDFMEVKYFLGIKIEYDIESGVIKLSQKQYLLNVLKKFEMQDCKSCPTPLEPHLKLKSLDINQTGKPYRELIGCLMYVMLTSRPDLSMAVGYFSRFQGCASDEHWIYLKRILRYIKGSLDLKLVYNRLPMNSMLVGYVDADWANDINDRRSITGYVIRVFGSTVSWASRKQSTVSLSSTEAEYIALCHAACEIIWLQQFLIEIGMSLVFPTLVFEDNQACIRIAEEPREHKRMKHIDTKYNFIRERIQEGKIQMEYVSTANQLADIMTKGLPSGAFEKFVRMLGLFV